MNRTNPRRRSEFRGLPRWAPAGLAVLAACGGSTSPDMGAALQGNFSELQPIFKRGCTFSSCHGMLSPGTGNLSLLPADAYCSLVGTTNGQTFLSSAQATFPRRVVKGDHTKSFVYKKLTLTAAEVSAGTLGLAMPNTGMSLSQTEIDGFAKWIDKGALDDTGSAPCN